MVALAAAVASVSAQDMLSKKGTPILPESGDWSIGFDATPILEHIGNVFYSSSSPDFPQMMNTLVGKKMTDENTAIRVKLRIGIGSYKEENLVNDDVSTASPNPMVVDTWKESYSAITIGGGIQKYRGKGRVRGFYGAEAGVSFGGSKHTYEYGNAITTTNNSPTSTDWSSFTGGSYMTLSPGWGSRVTEEKNGSSLGVNLNGFIGVEYFFAPKMSLGAEYGWGLSLTSWGEGEDTYEGWNGTGVETATFKTGKASNFMLDVMNPGGSIILSAYF